MDNLNSYKDKLYSLMYARINELFPDMQFREKGSKLISKHHLNGARDSQGQEITNTPTSGKYYGNVYDFARRESINLIDWYAERNSLTFWEALDRIADICNVEKFQKTTESEESKRIQENRENALRLFTSSLWNGSEQAQRVLDYLHSRKWSDDEIKRAELGLITTDLRPLLPDSEFYLFRGIGETHLLAIPIRTATRIQGFKFRYVGDKETEPKDKYIYAKGSKKTEALYGLYVGVKDIVVVEGELDALHAQVRGVNNITATSGNGISREQAQDAIKRGVERFNLLLDMDEHGQAFISNSLDILESLGAEVYISELPEPYKDTDEYLRDHTIEEWRDIVRSATPSYLYRYRVIFDKYSDREQQNGELSFKDREECLSEIISLMNSDPMRERPYNRGLLKDEINRTLGGLIIDFQGLEEYIESRYSKLKEIDLARKKENSLNSILDRLSSLKSEGKTEEALTYISESAKSLSDVDVDSEFTDRVKTPSRKDIRESLKVKRQGLPTPYLFGQGDRQEELILSAGKLTFVCAPTSHGKSKMLQNLALYTCQSEEEGSILYFPFEESAEDTIEQMTNNFIGETISKNNLRSIKTYHSRGEYLCSRDSKLKEEDFIREEDNFYSLLEGGKLRIYTEENDAEKLIRLIRYLNKTIKVKGVFIDYIQLLKIRNTRLSKREELGQIAASLRQLAKETGLPIVVAAQLNRAARSPLDLHNQNIAEAADLEREANVVLCLWNSSFYPDLNSEWTKTDADEKKKSHEQKHIEELGFRIGTGGQLYGKLTKNREGIRGIDAVFQFNGNTGRIKGNVGGQTSTSQTSTSSSPFDEMEMPF